ncbi:hypothetical protein L484_007105 [Morus notabilis]|uniref:Uncharacterized protein n=1 Tax=Morus notabilis TaxID=981085 RepID=W9SCZ5_9ROSA|nr:hypothetical protein L484_007105 [Morus notabilis]
MRLRWSGYPNSYPTRSCLVGSSGRLLRFPRCRLDYFAWETSEARDQLGHQCGAGQRPSDAQISVVLESNK